LTTQSGNVEKTFLLDEPFTLSLLVHFHFEGDQNFWPDFVILWHRLVNGADVVGTGLEMLADGTLIRCEGPLLDGVDGWAEEPPLWKKEMDNKKKSRVPGELNISWGREY